jgi:hypothetical protein
MYVDLKYRAHKKLPPGYELIGGIVTDNDCRGLLVRDIAGSQRYFVMMGNTLDPIADQQAVAQAVQRERDALAVLTATPAFPEAVAPPEHTPKKMMGVNLDEWTVQTLRAYGNGNLSAGIRQAAKLLVGVV